jgi:hypothetical protein
MFTRANAAKRWVGIAIVLGLVNAIFVGWVALQWSHPYRHPERYLANVETSARPLIDAIEAHTRREGSPPKTLEALLPAFDPSEVSTGYPPQRAFEYHVWRQGAHRPDDEWVLVLYTELLSLDSDVIQYNSRTRAWSLIHVR